MKPFISICTIFKDEEFFMQEFIQSYMEIADEWILVDTGSSDRSVEIIESFGIKVHFFPWVNDFGKARTHSLSLATGDWICVADVDDRITKKDAIQMKEYLKQCTSHAVISPYINLNNFDWKNLQPNILSTHDRMVFFKNHLGIEYRGAIHENPMLSIEENNYQVIPHNLPIYHLGYAEELISQKSQRNSKIIRDLYQSGIREAHIIYHYCNLEWSSDSQIYNDLIEALQNSDHNRKFLILESLCHWIYEFKQDHTSELNLYKSKLKSCKASSKVLDLFQARNSFNSNQVIDSLKQYQILSTCNANELSSRYHYEVHYRISFLLAANQEIQKALDYINSFDQYLNIPDFFHLKIKLLAVCGEIETTRSLLALLPKSILDLAPEKLIELKSIAK
ncbi:glycosyltransferase, partial [bacterium]|nr:glycosyltransferase [bacterium]